MNNEKIKTAFYYALRDTLVATDIDQASRIAYGPKRYRVVTLLGQVIELAGNLFWWGVHIEIPTVTRREERKCEASILLHFKLPLVLTPVLLYCFIVAKSQRLLIYMDKLKFVEKHIVNYVIKNQLTY